MSKIKIFEGAKGALNKFGFAVKKNSPVILMTAGIVGAVGGAVLACVATTKVSKIMDARREQLNAVDICLDESTEPYSEEDARKDRMIINVQSGAKLALLYAPAVAVEAASIACILASHGIMKKRNAAISAAYAAVDSGFKKYRQRVTERFGADTENEIAMDISSEKVETTEKDPETGKEKKVKKTVSKVGDGLGGNPYAMIFSADTAESWEKDHDYNMMYLRAEQQYATDRLQARGYLYLNEVFDRLGIEGTKMGQIVGWVYDPDNSEYDNYVDFGIKETETADGPMITLDFNVQGNILDLMDKRKD